MAFQDQTLQTFLVQLGEATPTPGGGTVAAVSAGLAAGLLQMYAGLSANSKKVAEADRAYCRTVAEQAAAWSRRALELADRDAAAYDAVVAAFRLPRDTEDQKRARREQIRQATLEAARVPMETAQLAEQVLRACQAVRDRGTPAARSDLETAYQLARSAGLAALENVDINLDTLDAAERPEDLVRAARDLRQMLEGLPRYLTRPGLPPGGGP